MSRTTISRTAIPKTTTIPKISPLPNSQKIRGSPSYHVWGFRPNAGKEREMEMELNGAVNLINREEGVLQTNIYKRLQGEGPEYIVIMIGKNPSVAQRLSKEKRFTDLQGKLIGLSKKHKQGQFSSALTGRLE